MINKRLLIKNLLSHNDECSFYDKKRQLNLHSREGKAKFLKHICALSNSNPFNNSYIIVGVEDEDNEISGVDFFDDSRIQNLVNAFLENPPKIQYDNVPFPNLPKDKVVGLVTIKPNKTKSFFKKNIHTILSNAIFVRIGSNSIPVEAILKGTYPNKNTVTSIENNSRNSIEFTIDGVIDFMTVRHKDIASKHKVFKELFVICWSGNSRIVHGRAYYSRVDIELINERIKLFYSALDVVTIEYNEDSFTIIEHVPLGLNDKTTYYPLEKVTINFYENGYYKIETQMLFQPPEYNKKMLFHIYNATTTLIKKLYKKFELTSSETKDFENIPYTLLICFLNGFDNAKEELIAAKLLFKNYENKSMYSSFKDVLRILRKIKYNSEISDSSI